MDWFRFYSSATNDLKLKRIAARTGQTFPHVLGVWTVVLSMASDSPIRGALLLTGNIPVTFDDVSIVTGCNVSETLQLFHESGMIHQIDGIWCVEAWDRRQFASDTSAERVRAYRDRVKSQQNGLGNDDVTLHDRDSNVTVTPPEYRVQSTDNREGAKSKKRERAPKAPPPPEIDMIRSLTGRYPDKALWPQIVAAISGKSDDVIRDAYTAWVGRGFNPTNYAWALEWVPNGIPPKPGKGKAPTVPNGLPAPEMLWGVVQAEIDRVHYSGTPNLPVPILSAIEAVGGWYTVCKCDPAGPIPARLRDAYRSAIGG